MLLKALRNADGSSLIPGWVAFLFGVSLTTNVVYLFKVGNTAVYVGYVFALCLAVIVVIRSGCLDLDLGAIDKSVWAFCGMASLSFVVSFALSVVGLVPNDTPLVALRGLVVLACGLIVYGVTVVLDDSVQEFLAGIGVGIVLSGIFSFVAQRAFDAGSYFTLYGWFPQESFSVSAQWEVWGQLPAGAGHIPSFRPQGLFLETSHLMAFLVCFAPLAFIAIKNRLLRVAVIAATAYCAVTSLSPNTLFLIIEIICLWSFTKKGSIKSLAARVRLNHAAVVGLLAGLFAAIVVLTFNSGIVVDAFGLISRGISDLDVSGTNDEGTLERFDSMIKALAVVPNYPLGSGWNTESIILQYWYGAGDVASHSYAVRLLIEVGIAGLVSYIYLIARHSSPLLGHRDSSFDYALGLAVVFLFVCQATNGTPLLPWAWALLGLARVRGHSVKKGVDDAS